MSVKKWIPWNWFKNEEESNGKSVPVLHASMQERGHALSNPIEQFHREFNQLFDRTFRGFGLTPHEFNRPLLPRMNDGILKPTLDLGATDKEYTVTLEIPGVDEKDVRLEIVNDTLTIQGEKKQGKGEKLLSDGAFLRVISADAVAAGRCRPERRDGNLQEGRIDRYDAQKGASESGREANRSQKCLIINVN
jgi:HSP20 family molecular chaperone IbpA